MKSLSIFSVSVFAAWCAVMLTGCASYDSNSQALRLAPTNMLSTTFKPNYEVGKTAVSATVEQTHFLFFSWGDADLVTDESMAGAENPEARRLMKAAVNKACLASKCDLVVGSTFQFERTGFLIGQTVRCTVHGFPAHVTSVEEVKTP